MRKILIVGIGSGNPEHMTIQAINAAGTTVLLVEQNAYLALRIARRGYVMENGRITLADRADALSRRDDVRAAYLGG